MTLQNRYAIVTPYFKEDVSLLRRCIDSVQNQSVKADHILVADGHPQPWIDAEPVRHITLDRAHGDCGNTPRGVGALIAIGEEYDGIGLLDADNWLDHDHVQKCLEAAVKSCGSVVDCDYVIAQRRFTRPDESVMPVPEQKGHVDTNCFFFLRGSFCVVPYWATMPKSVSKICDRVFYRTIAARPFRYAEVQSQTVNYQNPYEIDYRRLGEEAPAGAKPTIESAEFQSWAARLSPREAEIANRLCGFRLIRLKSDRPGA